MTKTEKISISLMLSIRVRDSDPLGTRLAVRGLVLGGWWRAKQRQQPLKYSPTHEVGNAF